MDNFFVDNQNNGEVPVQNTYPPQQAEFQFDQPEQPIESNFQQAPGDVNNFSYEPQPAFNYNDNENQFNDFEEDEVTRKIRQAEEKVQNTLREKSQKEWEDKKKRREEGSRQLQEFRNRKEQEKRERAEDNIRKQTEGKEERSKLNQQAGWKKVITNINVRQGERKGHKDTNRMREAILHRRADDES